MAKNVKNMTKQEMMEMIAQLQAQLQGQKSGKPKDAVFMKYNPETGKRDIPKECTQAQKAVWEKRANSYVDVHTEAGKAELKARTEKAHAAWKPSKEFLAWIDKNPCCTRDEAAAHGFKGTRADLKEWKRTHFNRK